MPHEEMPPVRDTSRRDMLALLGAGVGMTAVAGLTAESAIAATARRSSHDQPADLILRSGVVWPGKSPGMISADAGPNAEAIAIRGQRIVAVGRDQDVLTWAGNATRVVDLEGALVLPGFRDQHTHLLASAEEGAPAADYRPSFVCYDHEEAVRSRERIGKSHLELKERGVTPKDQCHDGEVTEELKRSLLLMQEEVARQGVTSVVEAGLENLAVWDALIELAEAGLLKVRFLVRVAYGCMEAAAERGLRTGSGNEWVTLLGVKNYSDGWLGPRTAALREPYSDDPYGFPPRGVLFLEQERADHDVARARELGFNVATHAIGDRGVETMLNAYERAGVTPDDRWALEHAQVVGDDLLERMAHGGVIASYQLSFATTDARFAWSALGRQRTREAAYRWDSMQRGGVRLAGSSDFGIEVLDPLWGLQRTVTRQDFDGFPDGGFLPGEGLTVPDALRTITSDNAFASFEEAERGTLSVGNYADMVVLRENLLHVPHHRIASSTRLMTITNGRIAAEGEVSYRPDNAEDC